MFSPVAEALKGALEKPAEELFTLLRGIKAEQEKTNELLNEINTKTIGPARPTTITQPKARASADRSTR